MTKTMKLEAVEMSNEERQLMRILDAAFEEFLTKADSLMPEVETVINLLTTSAVRHMATCAAAAEMTEEDFEIYRARVSENFKREFLTYRAAVKSDESETAH
jgi:hypothetical protein